MLIIKSQVRISDFTTQANNIEIPAKRYRTNEPKKASLRVPDLPLGNYRIEVRNTTRMGKSIRVGLYTTQLKVG